MHLPADDIKLALAELGRVIRPGGPLKVGVWGADELQTRIGGGLQGDAGTGSRFPLNQPGAGELLRINPPPSTGPRMGGGDDHDEGSQATTWLSSPAPTPEPSTKPRSARPASTACSTWVEFIATRLTAV